MMESPLQLKIVDSFHGCIIPYPSAIPRKTEKETSRNAGLSCFVLSTFAYASKSLSTGHVAAQAPAIDALRRR